MSKDLKNTGGGGGVDEAGATPTTDEKVTIPQAGVTPSMDDEPDDDLPQATPKARVTSIKSGVMPDNIESFARPNIPSFDYDPKTKKPNFTPGEVALVEVEKQGVRIYLTNKGRKIYVCRIPEYVEKFGALIAPRHIYEAYYPHAK